MSANALGVIFSNMHDENMQELTAKRTTASIPFGGRYRLIDFVLSNMYNSGITKVGVITKNNYQSLMDHLGSGKEWDMSHKREGLYILPPFGRSHSGIYKSRLEALTGIQSFLNRSTNDYVILADSDVVCNMNLNEPLEFHIKSGADITAVYQKRNLAGEKTKTLSAYKTNSAGRVSAVEIDPDAPGEYNVGLNIWIAGRTFLERVLSQAASRGLESWERDILQKGADELKIYGWEFRGYAGQVASLRDYFTVNMDVMRREVSEELFYKYGHIYTKVRDEVPAKYGQGARVDNCFVADGCIIEGEIENSVLFRGVHVGKGAKISNSIIMQGTTIGSNVKLSCLIVDKDAVIGDNRVLMGFETYPLFIGKGSMV